MDDIIPNDFKIRNSDKKDKELVLSDLISNIENKENEEDENFIRSFDSNSYEEYQLDNLNSNILKSPTFNYILEPLNSKEKNVFDRICENEEMDPDYFISAMDEANK